MGSPLGPALANASVIYFEKNWLQNCPSDFKPHYHRWYVDTFEPFRNFLNGRHANMLFKIENEK